MNAHRLPRSIIVSIVVLTIIPTVMSLFDWGFDYSTNWTEKLQGSKEELSPVVFAYYELSGPFLHTLLEWTAVCIAIFTGVLSIVHYRLKRDVTTPIIGTALFFSGMLDAFTILAADQLLFAVANLTDFIPFTWAVSRLFNVAILTAGTLPFIIRKLPPARQAIRQETRYLLLVGCLFGVMAYSIIHLFAAVIQVPEAIYPDLLFSRPWEIIPLLLWLALGLVILPQFSKKYPNLFSQSLILCALPAALLHLVAGFGSKELFDADFFNAYFLKIIAYGTPLIGLLLDYKNAYRAEVELEKTAGKLKVAQEIQQNLLPDDYPDIHGLRAAGFSFSAEAVGGDYYDYLPLDDGRFAFVVGDVSGHDLAASLLVAQTRAYMRAYLNASADLVEAMRRVNQALIADTQHRRFVTMFVADIDADRKSFSYIAAGHQGFLIRVDGRIETLDSNMLPIGMSEENVVQVGRIKELRQGDTILVVTDGITEAVSPTGEQYGLKRVLDFVGERRQEDVQQIAQALDADVSRYCAGKRPADDVTVVLVRWLK